MFLYATAWFHGLENYIRRQQQDMYSNSATFLFAALKVFVCVCYFSKAAIAFLFRTLINTLVVFIFKWWCFFLDINQIWLFWGKLQWIIASENMMDDLPNFRLSLRLCVLLTLVGSLLSWSEVHWLNLCMASALYVWISWIRWWPAPRVSFFCPMSSVFLTPEV